MGDVVIDYQKARSLLRLGGYETWQVTCITNLLKRHDDRVLTEKRFRIGRRKSASMLARQAAGQRVSAVPPYGWAVDPMQPWRLVPQPEEQRTLYSERFDEMDTLVESLSAGKGGVHLLRAYVSIYVAARLLEPLCDADSEDVIQRLGSSVRRRKGFVERSFGVRIQVVAYEHGNEGTGGQEKWP